LSALRDAAAETAAARELRWQAARRSLMFTFGGYCFHESWFDGLESALVTFGGVPEEVLFDNARALVVEHDPATRTVVFNDKLKAFAKHWGFRPRACAPYRARTKGKTENGVGYVKRNAIAGRAFQSWEAFEAHLQAWTRDVADVRLHGTTGEAPIERFLHA